MKATEDGQSAITGTNLNIYGSGSLTAVAKGTHAYGIGGASTESIKITGVHIVEAMGGHAYGVGSDTKYYKDAPEGGAAIGSGKDGAVITLNNVTVDEAIGGSKTAAIGANFHTGVTINITDSVIDYAEGGVSAAGIGGSRVSNGANESGTTINIINSNVTAQGGAYGAGIGSGYDTHCQSKQPLCTINISDSTIKAEGGQYAAGIGTGYHNAALKGEIKNSTIDAVSGKKVYKDTYTSAMDVGFGVVDPAREGQQTNSMLIYNGDEIYIPGVAKVDTVDELLAAVAKTDDHNVIILTENITLSDSTIIEKPITLDLNGKTLTVKELNIAADATISNGTIVSSANTNMVPQFLFSGANLEMNDVTVQVNHFLNANAEWSEAIGMSIENATAVLNNCNISINNQQKANWVFSYAIGLANANLTVNGGSITAVCIEGNVAPNKGPSNPTAISSYGNCTATLNNVEVEALYYGSAVAGCLTINTTDRSVLPTAFANNNGGRYALNFID